MCIRDRLWVRVALQKIRNRHANGTQVGKKRVDAFCCCLQIGWIIRGIDRCNVQILRFMAQVRFDFVYGDLPPREFTTDCVSEAVGIDLFI